MLTFVKFGGSVITDKTGQEAPDLPTIRRLAAELRAALNQAPPGFRLISCLRISRSSSPARCGAGWCW